MKPERLKAAFEQGRMDALRHNGMQSRYADFERDQAYQRGYRLEAGTLLSWYQRERIKQRERQGKRK